MENAGLGRDGAEPVPAAAVTPVLLRGGDRRFMPVEEAAHPIDGSFPQRVVGSDLLYPEGFPAAEPCAGPPEDEADP